MSRIVNRIALGFSFATFAFQKYFHTLVCISCILTFLTFLFFALKPTQDVSQRWQLANSCRGFEKQKVQRDGERDPVCKIMKPCKTHGEQGTDLTVLESLDVSVGVNMCKLKKTHAYIALYLICEDRQQVWAAKSAQFSNERHLMSEYAPNQWAEMSAHPSTELERNWLF